MLNILVYGNQHIKAQPFRSLEESSIL